MISIPEQLKDVGWKVDKGTGCKSRTVTAAVSAETVSIGESQSLGKPEKAGCGRRRKCLHKRKSEDLQSKMCIPSDQEWNTVWCAEKRLRRFYDCRSRFIFMRKIANLGISKKRFWMKWFCMSEYALGNKIFQS